MNAEMMGSSLFFVFFLLQVWLAYPRIYGWFVQPQRTYMKIWLDFSFFASLLLCIGVVAFLLVAQVEICLFFIRPNCVPGIVFPRSCQ